MNDVESLFGALASVPRLEGARCVGLWELFDSLEDHDVREAVTICEHCPALKPCRTWANSMSQYTFQGVVAGKPHRPRKPRPKPKPKPAAVPA